MSWAENVNCTSANEFRFWETWSYPPDCRRQKIHEHAYAEDEMENETTVQRKRYIPVVSYNSNSMLDASVTGLHFIGAST